MSLFRRDGRRLPGNLADETQRNEGIADADAARIAEAYNQRQQAKPPVAEAGRWEPRRGEGGIPTPIHDALQREYNALLLQLDETEQKLAAAEERIRGLKDTVAALAGHGPRMAMHDPEAGR